MDVHFICCNYNKFFVPTPIIQLNPFSVLKLIEDNIFVAIYMSSYSCNWRAFQIISKKEGIQANSTHLINQPTKSKASRDEDGSDQVILNSKKNRFGFAWMQQHHCWRGWPCWQIIRPCRCQSWGPSYWRCCKSPEWPSQKRSWRLWSPRLRFPWKTILPLLRALSLPQRSPPWYSPDHICCPQASSPQWYRSELHHTHRNYQTHKTVEPCLI